MLSQPGVPGFENLLADLHAQGRIVQGNRYFFAEEEADSSILFSSTK
jgi:hypothetical protein